MNSDARHDAPDILTDTSPASVMAPERSTRFHHSNVVIVVQRLGGGGPFWFSDTTHAVSHLGEVYEALENAQQAADRWLLSMGHQCDQRCGDWKKAV